MGDPCRRMAFGASGFRARRLSFRLGLAIVGICAAFVIVLATYEGETEIDLNSGRLRHRQFVAGLTIGSSVSETKFSKMAKPLVDPRATPNWKTAYASPSPFGLFREYWYGLVAADLRKFEMLCDWYQLEGFAPGDRERVLKDVFACLKSDNRGQLEAVVEEFGKEVAKKVDERRGEKPRDRASP